MTLQQSIERLYDSKPDSSTREEVLDSLRRLMSMLNSGEVRAAENSNGEWKATAWVKKGILLAFRSGALEGKPAFTGSQFFDKDTLELKSIQLKDSVRVVPGGSAVRSGSYVAPGVVIMPPSYVNIGAYVGEQTMIDSHVLVGSCAQVGKRVHLSAGTQIGGVLEPVGSLPVIIEDDVFIGGNCGIYEGAIVRHRAVVAAGVILTGSTPVYDLVHQTIYKKSKESPLAIPPNAVVIPGNRHIGQPFAKEHHLSVYVPVIIKYRDAKTDAATALEDSLR